MKKFGVILGTLLCSFLYATVAFANVSWPDAVTIEADGGIVMEAQTGTILYGKQMREAYYPASITKLLTALLVMEHCKMDETVTFSHNAIFQVESNSKHANLVEGDTLTVEECLYTLLLYSANEVANALAEHVSGSIEEFAKLMNEKARALGCENSNFVNPSGLNDPDHYTCAYDMALIARAAYQNPTLRTISGTPNYTIPPTKNCPEGQRISIGHKMLKESYPEQYDSRVLAGKTGYTSLAGNTLVTLARQNDLELIVVILNGHQTHYSDTKNLLDFGFEHFQRVEVPTQQWKPLEVFWSNNPFLFVNLQWEIANPYVCLPKGAENEPLSQSVSFDKPQNAAGAQVIRVAYQYLEKPIGNVDLSVIIKKPQAIVLPPKQEPLRNRAIRMMLVVCALGTGLILCLLTIRIINRYRYEAMRDRAHRQMRRLASERKLPPEQEKSD